MHSAVQKMQSNTYTYKSYIYMNIKIDIMNIYMYILVYLCVFYIYIYMYTHDTSIERPPSNSGARAETPGVPSRRSPVRRSESKLRDYLGSRVSGGRV